MYFFVDESGHSGPKLFDKAQPTLYYGVLSSRYNLDVLAEAPVKQLRRRLQVERLHAAELGNGRLAAIASDLTKLQQKLDLRFDLYRVNKSDHAVICFFDQVFDQGMNPAVPWHFYWTPLRYALLLHVATLFDDTLRRKAWDIRLNLKNKIAEQDLTDICGVLRLRAENIRDERIRGIIIDGLEWAARNPQEINYNASSKEEALSITPNVIGFQSVMMGIASRILKSGSKRPAVTVDRQSQFNKSQKSLAQFYAHAKGTPMLMGPGMPELDFRGIPDSPIRFSSSFDSVGLELTDLYLWTFKRFLEKKNLAAELYPLIKRQWHRGITDEISLSAINHRWSKWFLDLPDPTPEQLEEGKKLRDQWEAKRRAALIEAKNQG